MTIRKLTSLLINAAIISLLATSYAYADSDDWGDDDEDEGEYEDEEEDDSEQPPVYSGGNYRKDNYPFAELERPLTINKGILEFGAGLETSLAEGQAFEPWFFHLDARYGIHDALELQAEFSNLIAGEGDLGTYLGLGLEGAIMYDLVDFKVTLELPLRPCCTTDLSFGFPFRYKPKPQVALIALEKLMTIHLEGGKPDLTLGVGAVFQPHPKVAVVGYGELILAQFDPDFITVPVQVAIQGTPTRQLDLGLAITLGNVKNADDPFASRSMLLFGRYRL